MATAPQKVPIGQPVGQFPGGTINALVEDYYRRLAEGGGTGSGEIKGAVPFLPVEVHNTTDETVEPGEILGYDESVASLETSGDPSQVHAPVTLKGILAVVPDHSSRFVVALDYIGDDAVGPCAFMGLIWVAVNWTDAEHDHIEVADGEYLLQSSTSGIEPVLIGPMPDEFPGLVYCLILLGGGVSSGGSADIKIVLLDDDIDPGIAEDDPPSEFQASDFPDGGLTVVLQDPPDDDPTANLQDTLNAWAYERKVLTLKYFHRPSKTVITTGTKQGSGADTLVLEDGAFSEDGELDGLTIVVTGESGAYREIGTITDSDFDSMTVTVTPAWSPTPTGFGDYSYSVERRDPGYAEEDDGTPKNKLVLATETVDLPDGSDTTRVARYATTTVYYDDGQPFKVGSYGRADYPDYDENSPWPPDSVEDPDTFFKKRYRGIAVEGILITDFCKELPPPALPEE
jgi:hypothetical protein